MDERIKQGVKIKAITFKGKKHDIARKLTWAHNDLMEKIIGEQCTSENSRSGSYGVQLWVHVKIQRNSICGIQCGSTCGTQGRST